MDWAGSVRCVLVTMLSLRFEPLFFCLEVNHAAVVPIAGLFPHTLPGFYVKNRINCPDIDSFMRKGVDRL